MNESEAEYVLVAVEDLREGMRVDLEGDPYADPNHDNVALEYEHAVIASVDLETPTCTAVGYEGGWVGFPHGYQVKVLAEDAAQIARSEDET